MMFKLGDSSQNMIRKDHGHVVSIYFAMIKVLILDKKESLPYVAHLLHSTCSFEVTCVDQSGAALGLLLEDNNKFDLVLVDSDMSDIDIHTFLRVTKMVDVICVVMSEKLEDDGFIHEVISSGAFLVIKKPLTLDALWHLRQDIIRKRMHSHEKTKNKNPTPDHMETIQKNTSSAGKKKRVHRSSSSMVDDNGDGGGNSRANEKICVQWTDELHLKFLNAVNQLGDRRCFPKKILDIMGVPGLTRMQVASHLQKWRKEKMKFINKVTDQKGAFHSNPILQGLNKRKFGWTPALKPHQKDHEEINSLIDINLPIKGHKREVNQMLNQTYQGSSMMNMSNQKKTAHQIDNELNEAADRFCSRISYKTGNNYFQQAVLGLHDAGQGSNDQSFAYIQRQGYDEFPEFLRDLDGNGPNDI